MMVMDIFFQTVMSGIPRQLITQDELLSFIGRKSKVLENTPDSFIIKYRYLMDRPHIYEVRVLAHQDTYDIILTNHEKPDLGPKLSEIIISILKNRYLD